MGRRESAAGGGLWLCRLSWRLGRAAGVLACMLTLATALDLARAEPADAATFTVDHPGDEADATPGDGLCATAAARCTLRAAVEESNAVAGEDSVGFTPALPTVLVASPIRINDPLSIDGCSATPAALQPCVDLEGDGGSGGGGGTILSVGADDVAVSGLRFDAAGSGVQGIFLGSLSKRLTVRGSWFGTAFTTTGGRYRLETGVALYGNNATIGGTSASDRNIFVGHRGTAVKIHGGSSNVVAGNRFGLTPNGRTPTESANNKAITVAGLSTSVATRPASDNKIGTAVDAAAGSTRACDGGCNAIANTRSVGLGGGTAITLIAEGATQTPAVHTRIEGNYIGLTSDGQVDPALRNAGAGVLALEAADAKPVDVLDNIISGNDQGGVIAGPEAVIARNLFGGEADGDQDTGAEGNGGNDVRVGTNDPAHPSHVAVNTFLGGAWASQSRPIQHLRLGGATYVRGNTLGVGPAGQDRGAVDAAIRIDANSNHVGGPDEGDRNVIGNARGTGVDVAGGDRNEVAGNRIGVTADGAPAPNGGPGVRIANSLSNTAVDNVVGGESDAYTNLISNSGGAAVEVAGDGNDSNLIARNRGSGNAGLFHDLVPAAGLGNDGAGGPNEGVQAPAVSSTDGTTTAGTAAPGATIDVYRKATAAPGEVASHLGSTTAAGDGTWVLTHAPFAGGYATAAQSVVGSGIDPRNTSELAAPVAGPPAPAPAPDPPPAQPPAQSDSEPADGSSREPSPREPDVPREERDDVRIPEPPVDTTPPVLRLSKPRGKATRLGTIRRKGLRVRVASSEACVLSGKLRVGRRVARRLALGKRAATLGHGKRGLPANTPRVVKLKLGRKVKRRLQHVRRVKTVLTITCTDAPGNRSTSRTKLTLRR